MRFTRYLVGWLVLMGACADSGLERMEDVDEDVRWCAEERPAHIVISDRLPEKCVVALDEAVEFWRAQGVDYLTLAVVPDEDITLDLPQPRFIQVVTQPPADGASGDTRIHRYSVGCIDGAQVRLDPTYCREGGNTVAHELGHALGLQHVKASNNLMFPASLPNGFDLTASQREHVR